jgi:ribosomal protein S17E
MHLVPACPLAVSSTSMRNRIAGYTTRLVRIRMRSDAGAVR